ncbi:MAG: SNF2-related protein [Parachlamydiales bacterium]|jgi:superfamily II DNA or RNA helicase
MLNFRKLKHDFSPALLKEGKGIYDRQGILEAKIAELTPHRVRLAGKITGSFEHNYACELEVNLDDSTLADSECNCPNPFDCQHLAALIFFMEHSYDKLVVEFSSNHDVETSVEIEEEEKEDFREAIRKSHNKEEKRKDKHFQKELLEEYTKAAKVLGTSPYFVPDDKVNVDNAEIAIIFTLPADTSAANAQAELQVALRLPYRSKLVLVPNIAEFLNAVRYREAFYIGTRRYLFTLDSFDSVGSMLLKGLLNFAQPIEGKQDKSARNANISVEVLGDLLADIYDISLAKLPTSISTKEDGEALWMTMPCLYQNGQEEPLRITSQRSQLQFSLEYLETPVPAILIKPTVHLEEESPLNVHGLSYFPCARPGVISQNVYYRFPEVIKRKHLRHLISIGDLAIPQPLFGTFVENSLSELMRYGKVLNKEVIERFVTMPFVSKLQAECEISYLSGELETKLFFLYNDTKVPASHGQLKIEHIDTFVTDQGILARNLTEEQAILDDLFQGFTYDPVHGAYFARSEKKIIEFMTEVVPRNQQKVIFNSPPNLLEHFVYDDSSFSLTLKESDRVDSYEVTVKVDGHLHGIGVEQLWECISMKRSYVELEKRSGGKLRRSGDGNEGGKLPKILVLDLERLSPVVQIFDELGIKELSNHKELRPLWSLANIDLDHFNGLPIKFSMSKKLIQIQEQMLGTREMESSPIPEEIKAQLRTYQIEGVQWLERLRSMHLNGILADDMGLGKTLQAIIAIAQLKLYEPHALTLIVAPTSLIYNWKEEFNKFNPKLKILIVDGTPQQRRKLIQDANKWDVVVTSYSLLQKDTDHYKAIPFSYAILDEAQHIKNRGTRNAKSVKLIQAPHRLILTGTPIENSLDELWSLFDFLMPGLLSSYDRFVEKYIRAPKQGDTKAMETLRRKVSPFILRRMKKDVLKELPPLSEIVYHCHLSEIQRELYRSYAASAREELSQLVKKEGFDRVQIHVLATLTRLKQICCHPAIFAKETMEPGDSAKYDMLIELLQTLIQGGHKTVIFSQYTRMLSIMREDFIQRGITFEYLDGSCKDRLDIVNRFNNNPDISVFLVSLKAGGVGLNLIGADTVIHFDMWWNPAVENQATDRLHRFGQQQSVTSIKLVTLNTIEEKILELQQRKKGLVRKVISCDEEAIAKLTWEEVLELLQT